MTAITLQIALPNQLHLSPEELAGLTGRHAARLQIAWLQAQGWEFSLDTDKGVLVGKLYAHLRLAGLQPAAVAAAPGAGTGFDLGAVR